MSYPDAQTTLNLQPGDTLYINPGVYSGLSLGNLSGTAAKPITVRCDPQAMFTTATPQSNTFPNVAHARFEDFRFESYKSTCLKITGQSHDVLFKNFHLKDVSGYSFYIYDATKVFDGTRESTFYNNISWEKRQYPMYEQNHVRQADIDKSSGYLSRAASEVCFNTLFRSRRAASSGDPYCATLVDVYGPNVMIKHNLVIEPEVDVPFDPTRNYVYHLGAGPQTRLVVDSNRVFSTWAEAGSTDTETFMPLKTSPIKDAVTGRIAYIPGGSLPPRQVSRCCCGPGRRGETQGIVAALLKMISIMRSEMVGKVGI